MVSWKRLDLEYDDAISRIRFAPSSKNLLISSWDSKLRLYDVGSSELRLETPAKAALLDCCFQNDSVALSACSDGFIRSHDLDSGNIKAIGKHDDTANRIGFSVETQQVVSAGLDKKIIFWDERMCKEVFKNILDSEVTCMSLSGSNMMVTTGADIDMYDLRNLKTPQRKGYGGLGRPIACGTLVREGFAVGTVDGILTSEFFLQHSMAPTKSTFHCHPMSDNPKLYQAQLNDIVFNPSMSGTIITGDEEGHVIAWDVSAERLLCKLHYCPNSVASLSYDHEGQLLAVASSYTYGQAVEKENATEIFIHETDDDQMRKLGFQKQLKNPWDM